MCREKKELWQELITGIDMTQNSKQAWKTIQKLNTERNKNTKIAAVTPDKVAHQLLLNGNPQNKERGYKKKMKAEMAHTLNDSAEPYTIEELKEGIKTLNLAKHPDLMESPQKWCVISAPKPASGSSNYSTPVSQYTGYPKPEKRTKSWLY